MPVKADSATRAGVDAVGAAGCAVAAGAALVAVSLGFVGVTEEDDGAGVDGPVDVTAEAMTRSIDELSAAHVASSSTPAVTKSACLSWLTGLTPTRAASVPTVVTWGDGLLSWSICADAAGFSQMVSARPTACAGQFDCALGDPR